MTDTSQFPHEQLLKSLLDDIEKDVAFYRQDSKANYFGWHVLMAASILLSGASSLIAALLPPEDLKEPMWRGLLITLPIVGTVAAAFLKTFNFHERERNREVGLIEAERLLRTARSKFASAANEDDFKKAFLETTGELARLSHDQHKLDVATRLGIGQTASGQPPPR